MSSKAYAIDANVILRHLLGDNEHLSPKAVSILAAVEDGELVVLCDPVTLAEVVWVCKTSYRLHPEEIAEELLGIIALDGFHIPNKSLYVTALRLYGTSVPHFGDACACAHALAECDGRLLSFDKKLSGVEGVLRAEEV